MCVYKEHADDVRFTQQNGSFFHFEQEVCILSQRTQIFACSTFCHHLVLIMSQNGKYFHLLACLLFQSTAAAAQNH